MTTTPRPPQTGPSARTFARLPTTMLGAGEPTVLAELGRPDSRRGGRHWRTAAGDAPGSFERGPDGVLRAVAVFGPVPSTLAPGTPYRVWTYHRVQGECWLLYFAASATGNGRELVEVTHHPEGAVF